MDKIDYKSILPVTLFFAGDLYYLNGEKKKSIKTYKQILVQDSDNLEACARLYHLYNDDLNYSTKAKKYKARYEQIVIDKQNEISASEDLDIEINELKKVN